MKPIQLGIIGCGIAARELHWPALVTMKDTFEVTMVCNHTEPKAKSFAELVGGVGYVTDYHELLSSDSVEAVSVILPFVLNRTVTEDAIKAGKHVIVEKPLAGSITDAKEMVSFGERFPSLVMMVAENFRYRPLYARVKELLDERAVGKPYAVIWNFFTDVGSAANKPYLSTRWRIDHTYPGGFLTDGGVHITAVLRDLFGNIRSAKALTTCVNPKAGKVDTMISQFVFESGLMCSVNQFYSSKGLRVNSLHIFGDSVTLVVDNYTGSIAVKHEGKEDSIVKTEDERGYVGEYEDFYRAIRTGTPVVCTFEEAKNDLQAILCALESADKGEVTEISN